MSQPLLIALVCLAAYRLTRLLVADEWPPSDWMRHRVMDRTGDDSAWSYLVHCPWCMGVWVSAAVVLATEATIGLPAPALVWGAASAACGLIAGLER